jgi:hypothetical protein
MHVEHGTNRSSAVIHGSDPEIDISSLSLGGPSLTGDQPESINSIPRSPHIAATDWEFTPTRSPQIPDTYAPTPPHVPQYATDPRSESIFSGSPLNRWLSEDNKHERLILGLALIEDSSSFDCKWCEKTFGRASDLTCVYTNLYHFPTDSG